MSSIILLLISIINYSVSSSTADAGGDLSSFLTPSPTSPEFIYKLERNKIISFFQKEFGTKSEFTVVAGKYPEFESAMRNLLNLGAKELLEGMIGDNSGYFLAIFWFSYHLAYEKLNFTRTNTLYSLEFPVSDMDSDDIKEIFDNFRFFILQAFVSHSHGKDSVNSSKSYELLSIMQMFWNEKLEPLGIKKLESFDVKMQRKYTENRLQFLNYFLDNDPKVLIIEEYNGRGRQYIENNFIFDNRDRFFFLAQHLVYRMESFPSTESLIDLEWLAAQSQLFLHYFSHCLRNRGGKPPLPEQFLDPMNGVMRNLAKFSTIRFLRTFLARTFISEWEQDRAGELACMVIAKMEPSMGRVDLKAHLLNK